MLNPIARASNPQIVSANSNEELVKKVGKKLNWYINL